MTCSRYVSTMGWYHTFTSVPPCLRCESAPKGYVPFLGKRGKVAIYVRTTKHLTWPASSYIRNVSLWSQMSDSAAPRPTFGVISKTFLMYLNISDYNTPINMNQIFLIAYLLSVSVFVIGYPILHLRYFKYSTRTLSTGTNWLWIVKLWVMNYELIYNHK